MALRWKGIMTAPLFLAADNVPGCGWQTEGDDLELLCDASWDHIIDEHQSDAQEHSVTYTHARCGNQCPDVMAARWHVFFGCRGVMAEVES